ncbi:MAG: four helix bundle protein [Alistipes sp.]|nr:four helix bundle protein [Alistipes sp.]
MKSDNIVLDKSFNFAVRIVKLYKYLRYTIDEKVLSTQVLKSGTSIGANIREALRSSSRKDFVAKMNISLKEAYETEYWLELLYKTEYISDKEYHSIFPECRELTNILSQIVLTTKSRDEANR